MAERTLGELLEQMPHNEGGGNGSNQHQRATSTQEEPVAKPPTLAEIGISYKQTGVLADLETLPKATKVAADFVDVLLFGVLHF